MTQENAQDLPYDSIGKRFHGSDTSSFTLNWDRDFFVLLIVNNSYAGLKTLMGVDAPLGWNFLFGWKKNCFIICMKIKRKLNLNFNFQYQFILTLLFITNHIFTNSQIPQFSKIKNNDNSILNCQSNDQYIKNITSRFQVLNEMISKWTKTTRRKAHNQR